MMKRILAFLMITLCISSAVSFADFVDTSNRIHADKSNDIIRSAFVGNGNTVIIYLDNEKGIDYDLGMDIDNISIPFVKIKSVELEMRKYGERQKKEIGSEYYNKIVLRTDNALHEKQRFVIIHSFKDADGALEFDDLLQSIAPRGDVHALDAVQGQVIVGNTIDEIESVENVEIENDRKSDATSNIEPTKIQSANFLSESVIEVIFTDPVNTDEAKKLENYDISKGTLLHVEILSDTKILVEIDHEHLKAQSFELTIKNLVNQSTSANGIMTYTFYNTDIINKLIEELRNKG